MQPIIDMMEMVFRNKHKALICGNGGLAAESEHFAAELMGKYGFEVYLPCIALTTNTSLITALANDYGYEKVFSHQIKALGNEGDLLIAMTTSNSKNIFFALGQAFNNGMITVLLSGKETCYTSNTDHVYVLKGSNVAEMQNDAILLLHKIAFEVKRRIYNGLPVD